MDRETRYFHARSRDWEPGPVYPENPGPKLFPGGAENRARDADDVLRYGTCQTDD